MPFLLLLIALVVERFLPKVEKCRPWGWLGRYSAWLEKVTTSTPLKGVVANYCLALFSIVIALLFVENIFFQSSGSLAHAIFSLIVLLFCFGPVNFYQSLSSYTPLEPKVDGEIDNTVPVVTFAAGQAAKQANRQLFAPFFWFALLGVFGVVLYRVSERLPRNDLLNFIVSLLDWIPVRLLCFSCALVSVFISVFPKLLKQLLASPKDNDELLTACVNLSLGEDNNAVHLQALLDRSMIVWLVIVALIVLI